MTIGRIIFCKQASKTPDRPHVKDDSLIQGRHRTGQYIISGDEACAEKLRDWITQYGFEQYERETLRFDRHGKTRNKLYSFHLPETECEVVLKTCRPAPEYKWPRRFELALRQSTADYNKAAFLGCRMMRRAGMPVARPFAYWNVRRSLLDQTSYFLYQKIVADCPLNEWCAAIRRSGRDNATELLDAAKTKAMTIVRTMHDAGYRHGDPHGWNFLVKPALTEGGLSPVDMQQIAYYLIDYDQCTRAMIRIPPIKRFFDLRELRRIDIDGTSAHQLLDIYLAGMRSRYAHAVLAFWRRGGFHPWRWIVPEYDKKDGRHLKEPKQNIRA